MEKTRNLGLLKPERSDFFSVDYQNDNLDKIDEEIGNKVDKVEGKGLSANDFSDAEKEKLAGVASGAEVNVQADWDAADTGSDAFIKNKPVIPTVPAALKNPQALTFTGGVMGSYDGSSAKSVAIPAAGTTSPRVAGTASAGTAATFSRSDHVHPLQTSVSGSSGSCTGNAASATKAMQDGNGKVIASTYLPLAGGTLTGNLTVKNGTSNYGSKINLGDGDYVHISEPTDDCMEIKAKKVNFVISDTTDSAFTINGTKLLRSTDTAASAIKATQDGNGNVISSTYATKGIVIAEGSFRPAGGECRFSIPSNALHTLANYDGSMSYMEKNYLAGKYVVLRIIGVIYGKGSFVQDVFLLVPEGVNPDVNHYDYSCKVYPRYDNSVSSEYLTLSTSLSYILSVSGSGTNIYIYSITAF